MASDIIIEETASDTCVNEVLLSTLTASISSDDRFQVLTVNFFQRKKFLNLTTKYYTRTTTSRAIVEITVFWDDFKRNWKNFQQD